ncbi:MAG: hypothetical protein WA117_04165 [Verrucomicrobiia bacterium]
MRTLALISIGIWLLVQPDVAAPQSVEDVARQLRTTMTGTEGAPRVIVAEINAATPEQRQTMMIAIHQIVEDAFKTAQPRSEQDIDFIAGFASVLGYLPDEKTILELYGSRLTQIDYDAEPFVLMAMAKCHDPQAVQAMADLARLRLKQIKELLPQWQAMLSGTDKEKRAVEDMRISATFALMGLATSVNASGKPLAREFRDELIRLFEGSPYQEYVISSLANKLNPLLHKASRSGHSDGVVLPPPPKQPQQSRPVSPAPVSVSDQTRGASKMGMVIAAVVAGVVIFGFLIWLLRKK